MNDRLQTSYYARVLGEASNTALNRFRESPLAYWHWCNDEDEDPTVPMREGTAFHMALQEPERFARRYITIPDMPLTSKEGKQLFVSTMLSYLGERGEYAGEKADDLRKKMTARLAAGGVHILSEKYLATMKAMVESLNLPCHKVARSFVAGGKKELELHWTDAESGIKCKALLDSWEPGRGVLSDLKRTTEITHRDFRWSILNRGYNYQIAMYRRALRAHGEDPRYSCFVCASPDRPHYWAVYHIDPDAVEASDRRISEDLISLAECLNKNEWPTINRGEPSLITLNTEHI
jgi:exodeoxyribonuclease VIII